MGENLICLTWVHSLQQQAFSDDNKITATQLFKRHLEKDRKDTDPEGNHDPCEG